MPALPVNRTNAWECWKTGRIAATNIDNMGVDAPGNQSTNSILRNLAIKHGYNAIRLWFHSAPPVAGKDYSVLGQDMIKIGEKGWADTTNRTWCGLTFDEVRSQVLRVLDICESLGMGVILTGNFFSGKTSVDGRLWVDNPNSEAADPDGRPIGPTKAAAMQASLVAFWKQTLLAFGTHKALIGIDLLNEPKPPILGSLAMARYNYNPGNPRLDAWAPLAAKLVTELRNVDPSAATNSTLPRIPYIIAEDMSYGLRPFLSTTLQDACTYKDMKTNPAFLVRDCTPLGGSYGSVADDRIVYTIHTYRPLSFAQQGVIDELYCALGVTYPPNGLTREDVADEAHATTMPTIQNFRTAAGWDKVFEQAIAMKALGVPVFLGEFGSVEPNLDRVHPPKAGRGDLQQGVSNVKAQTVQADTPLSDLNMYRQITQIEKSTDGQTYIFQMKGVPFWSQPLDSVDESISAVLSGQGIGSQNYPKDGNICRVSPTPFNAANWNAEWYRNDHALATVQLYVGGEFRITPLVKDVQITLCNNGDGAPGGSGSGIMSFSVPVSQVAIDQVTMDPITKQSLLDQAMAGPIVAALSLKSARTFDEISAARLAWTKDVLRLCQRNRFSWAHFQETCDGPAFVGWRPTPAMREVLSKAARGEQV
jgi:hypothetical protein